MRSGTSVLVAVSLSLGVVACGDQEQAHRDEARLAELERENLALKREAAELRSKLEEFYAEKAGRTYTAKITIPFDGQSKPEHLREIVLPANATKEEARLYVARILRAAQQHRSAYGDQDPEVAMLERIGPEHADVLIEPLLHVAALNGDIYLIEALKSVVREQHKPLVLDSLPLARHLIRVVQARGWTQEAAPILLAVLEDRDSWERHSLPTEWIEAVASLQRPATYDALKTFFYYGTNRYHTWKAIRELPGMDISEEVDLLWRWAKELDDDWQRVSVAAVAAHYGHLDALKLMFEKPDQWRQREVIQAVTPYRGPREDVEGARSWYSKHHDQLIYDKEAGQYRIGLPDSPEEEEAR